jgi:Na+/melibiose symporter-like transporter
MAGSILCVLHRGSGNAVVVDTRRKVEASRLGVQLVALAIVASIFAMAVDVIAHGQVLIGVLGVFVAVLGSVVMVFWALWRWRHTRDTSG